MLRANPVCLSSCLSILFMPVINNSKDLQVEKLRLLAMRADQERGLKSRWTRVEKQIAPYRKFVTNNFASISSSRSSKTNVQVKRTSPYLQNIIQYGIPLLIDRVMLGKKGFMIKELGTWLSGRLANRVVADPPVQTFHKISQLFSEIKRIPIVGKLIERQVKKI